MKNLLLAGLIATGLAATGCHHILHHRLQHHHDRHVRPRRAHRVHYTTHIRGDYEPVGVYDTHTVYRRPQRAVVIVDPAPAPQPVAEPTAPRAKKKVLLPHEWLAKRHKAHLRAIKKALE